MNLQPQMKQRLIGVVIIISLVIIFLPIILDGSGSNYLSEIRLDIPARPKLIFDQQFENLPSNTQENITTLQEEIDLQKLGSGWVLKTGSFKDMESANEQIAELLKYGFRAKSVKTDVANGNQFEVIIGPITNKNTVGKMATSIENSMKISPTIEQRARKE